MGKKRGSQKEQGKVMKKKRGITKENRPTFVGFCSQYFKHKDDKKVIRRQGKQIVRDYEQEKRK